MSAKYKYYPPRRHKSPVSFASAEIIYDTYSILAIEIDVIAQETE